MIRSKADPRSVKIVDDGEWRTSFRVNELSVGTMSCVRVCHAPPLDEVRRCYAGATYPVEIIEKS